MSNSGDRNSGNYNSGNYNSGDRNSGNCNSGYCNSGNYNSGYYNSGNYNSGNYNSGDRNSGNCNSGYCNSGNYNSGYYNSGYYNSGYYNSGNYNSGNYNSGNYNSGDRNSGYFNTDEPNVRLFNKDSGKKLHELELPNIQIKLTEWVDESLMTDEQKKNDIYFRIKGRTLVIRSYKDAWALAWRTLDKKEKEKLFALPNFDAKIFEEITGINVKQENNNCNGKIVEIDGKKYKLEEVK